MVIQFVWLYLGPNELVSPNTGLSCHLHLIYIWRNVVCKTSMIRLLLCDNFSCWRKSTSMRFFHAAYHMIFKNYNSYTTLIPTVSAVAKSKWHRILPHVIEKFTIFECNIAKISISYCFCVGLHCAKLSAWSMFHEVVTAYVNDCGLDDNCENVKFRILMTKNWYVSYDLKWPLNNFWTTIYKYFMPFNTNLASSVENQHPCWKDVYCCLFKTYV